MKQQFTPRLFGVTLTAFLLTVGAGHLSAQQQTRSQGSSRSSSSGSSSRSYPASGAIGDAYFSIDTETRRVVTIADEDTTRYISLVLSNLDRPKPQVLIKVLFLEVARNNSSEIGIEGGWSKNIGNSTTGTVVNAFGLSGLASAASTNSAVNVFGQPVSSFAPTPPGAGLYQILGQDYQVTLRAIAQAGNAKVLSRPSVLARNNQPATIKVGQSVPLITGVRYDNYGNTINSFNYRDVGVILTVTPFITADGMVEMIVQPEISSVDTTSSVAISADTSAPILNIRSADTVVVTPDGQTVIIGGLLSSTKAQAESKIPVLGDIPLLGNLFKSRSKSDSQTELLIFLTPHVVQAPSELASLSDREREKMGSTDAFTDKELEKFLENLPQTSPDGGKAKKKKSR